MLGIVIGSCVLAVILLVTDQREATKSVTSIPRESSYEEKKVSKYCCVMPEDESKGITWTGNSIKLL